jgi:hypothetical protein
VVSSAERRAYWYRLVTAAALPPGVWARLCAFADDCQHTLHLQRDYRIGLFADATPDAVAASPRLTFSRALPTNGVYHPGDAVISVRVDQSEAALCHAIAHELKHAQQFELTGDTTATSDLPYAEYVAHPDEREAEQFATWATFLWSAEHALLALLAEAEREQQRQSASQRLLASLSASQQRLATGLRAWAGE